MFQELLQIFRPGNPLEEMASGFAEMLELTHRMTLVSGRLFLEGEASPEERDEIYRTDIAVNRLERALRRRVVTHLSVARSGASLPYCLLLIGLVKDVERLGDYAKNVSEIPELMGGPLPDDEIVEELREIRAGVEESFRAASEIFQSSDRRRAMEMIRQGKDFAKRCDRLLLAIARSDYSAGEATATALGARYYKRIGGHLLNVLSSVVMPLHKVDYFDEDELP